MTKQKKHMLKVIKGSAYINYLTVCFNDIRIDVKEDNLYKFALNDYNDFKERCSAHKKNYYKKRKAKGSLWR